MGTKFPYYWRATSASYQNAEELPTLVGDSVACMRARSLQLCPTLFDPMIHSPPVSSVYGIPRQEYWSGLPGPPPGDLPNSWNKPTSLKSPVLAGRFFTTSSTWEAQPQWQWLSTWPPITSPLGTLQTTDVWVLAQEILSWLIWGKTLVIGNFKCFLGDFNGQTQLITAVLKSLLRLEVTSNTILLFKNRIQFHEF